MRRRGAGVWAAAVLWGGLAAAAGGPAHAEDLPQAPVKTGGWWGVLFKDKSDDKPAAQPASPAQPATTPAAAPGTMAALELPASEATPALPASTVLQQAEEAYQRERQAWARRVEVCDRLREIALIKGDPELENQANALEAQAWQVWEQRTARLPRPAPSGKRPADTNIDGAAALGSRAPLHRSPSQLPEGQGLRGGTVTGEEKP